MPSEHEKISRRSFLGAGAAATALALTGCGDSQPQQQPREEDDRPIVVPPPVAADAMPNPMNILGRYEMRDQQGQPFSVRTLGAQLRNTHYTLSFGFNGCSAYCPLTNATFAMLDEQNGHRIKHVVVNVNPELDGFNQSQRDAYLNTLTAAGVRAEDIIILYPARNSDAPRIAVDLGSTVRMDDSTQHTPKVMFYGPGHRYLTQQLSTTPPRELINDFQSHMQRGGQQR